MIIHAKYKCSIINTSEDMNQVSFCANGRTDRWRLMPPALRKAEDNDLKLAVYC